MNKTLKRLDVLSSISIIILALTLSAVIAKNYLFNRSSETVNADARRITAMKDPIIGRKLTSPDIDWAKNGRTLVLALQKGCHFCSESAPFYKSLREKQAGMGNIHLVAVLPQTTDVAREYLNGLGISVDEVKQASLDSLDVAGTPTLLLVDNAGTVLESWRGKLPPDQENKVIERLRKASNG